MRYRTLLALPILILSWCPGRASAQAPGNSYVLASPYEGHPGDPVFVTGEGFKPGAKELLTMACPNAAQAGTNYTSVLGPTVDSQGRFVRGEIHAPPSPNPAPPLICTVYASIGPSPFGPVQKGSYLLVPPHQQLNFCAAHICKVRVAASPVRVRYGVVERIVIHDPGWPGAFVSVSLRYGGDRPAIRHMQLDYQGAVSMRWPIRVRVGPHSKPLKVSVSVYLHLGSAGGGGGSSFFVVH